MRNEAEQFRLLVESVEDYAIFMLDPEGRIVTWNCGAQRIKGYAEDEVLGRHFSIFYTEEDRKRGHPEEELRIAAERGRYQEEGLRVRKDGVLFPADVTITAMRDHEGRLVGFSKVTRDITERRRAEEVRESERRFREISATIREVFWIASPDFNRVLYVSPAYETVWGRSTESLYREPKSFLQGIFPEDRHRALEFMEQLAGHEASIEHRILRPDGEVRWLLMKGFPVRGRGGETQRIVGVSEDITERKQTQQALRESERVFRALANSIPQLAWMAGPDGSFFWYNDRWYDYTGTTFDEMQGWGWRAVIHPGHGDRVAERIRHAFDTGEPWEDTFPLRSRTGEYRWFLSRAVPIRDGEGDVIRWFGTNTDVTEQLVAAAQREELFERERKARERVTTILESITDAFFALDREWRFTYVNHEAERVLLKSRGELLGRNVWEEFPEAVGSAFDREYHRAMAGQVPVEFEEFYPALETWLEVRAYPSPEGLSVYFHDVTGRRRASEALRESEERYRLLVDMIPQHVWTTDPEGNNTWFSRRWYEYTGSTPEQTRGKGWLDQLHPADTKRTVARWRKSLRTGKPYLVEYRVRRADGKYCWFLGQAMPLRNGAGEIVRWFGTLTDISERKELEKEHERLLNEEQEARSVAERRRDELERMTDSRTRLMRGFSHDVKNPLGAADGYLQLMEEELEEELEEEIHDRRVGEVKGIVGKVRRSIRAALNLIEDLLELARAEGGEIAIRLAPTDLREVALEAAEEYRAQAEVEGLFLAIDLPDHLPVIDSDAGRIRQVVGNLLSNAVKYTGRGGITVRVEVREGGKAPGPGTWIAVEVSDTGPGLSGEQQRLLFQEFHRLENAGGKKGTGIGLSISRRIAQALGGDITVDSEIGMGSTFTLWLPTGSVEERPATYGADQRGIGTSGARG